TLHLGKFRLDKIGVVSAASRHPEHRLNVRSVLIDLDASGAGIIFRKNESDDRSRDGDQEEDRDNYGFPDPDDAPIVQEMQCCFLNRLIFNWFHISKK